MTQNKTICVLEGDEGREDPAEVESELTKALEPILSSASEFGGQLGARIVLGRMAFVVPLSMVGRVYFTHDVQSMISRGVVREFMLNDLGPKAGFAAFSEVVQGNGWTLGPRHDATHAVFNDHKIVVIDRASITACEPPSADPSFLTGDKLQERLALLSRDQSGRLAVPPVQGLDFRLTDSKTLAVQRDLISASATHDGGGGWGLEVSEALERDHAEEERARVEDTTTREVVLFRHHAREQGGPGDKPTEPGEVVFVGSWARLSRGQPALAVRLVVSEFAPPEDVELPPSQFSTLWWGVQESFRLADKC